MAERKDRKPSELNLAKLGIREIHERIEVSPIITDPGALGLSGEGSTKTYTCTVNFKDPIGDTWDIM